ncbi:MAG TPA: DUF3307 domain-containing protein [Devosiaceae bacterium]|nr:DUF3307 domain-containing protein [Devosiaceae bacterium]
MPEIAILILAAVAVLMLKHMAADFFLQTPYQYCNKGTYGHPGGLLHSAIHVTLTPLVYLMIAPVSLLLAAGIALGEFAVHYHIDWAKEQIGRRNNFTPQTPGFWHLLGVDQLLHGLTYLAIVAVLVWAAS